MQKTIDTLPFGNPRLVFYRHILTYQVTKKNDEPFLNNELVKAPDITEYVRLWNGYENALMKYKGTKHYPSVQDRVALDVLYLSQANYLLMRNHILRIHSEDMAMMMANDSANVQKTYSFNTYHVGDGIHDTTRKDINHSERRKLRKEMLLTKPNIKDLVADTTLALSNLSIDTLLDQVCNSCEGRLQGCVCSKCGENKKQTMHNITPMLERGKVNPPYVATVSGGILNPPVSALNPVDLKSQYFLHPIRSTDNPRLILKNPNKEGVAVDKLPHRVRLLMNDKDEILYRGIDTDCLMSHDGTKLLILPHPSLLTDSPQKREFLFLCIDATHVRNSAPIMAFSASKEPINKRGVSDSAYEMMFSSPYLMKMLGDPASFKEDTEYKCKEGEENLTELYGGPLFEKTPMRCDKKYEFVFSLQASYRQWEDEMYAGRDKGLAEHIQDRHDDSNFTNDKKMHKEDNSGAQTTTDFNWKYYKENSNVQRIYNILVTSSFGYHHPSISVVGLTHYTQVAPVVLRDNVINKGSHRKFHQHMDALFHEHVPLCIFPQGLRSISLRSKESVKNKHHDDQTNKSAKLGAFQRMGFICTGLNQNYKRCIFHAEFTTSPYRSTLDKEEPWALIWNKLYEIDHHIHDIKEVSDDFSDRLPGMQHINRYRLVLDYISSEDTEWNNDVRWWVKDTATDDIIMFESEFHWGNHFINSDMKTISRNQGDVEKELDLIDECTLKLFPLPSPETVASIYAPAIKDSIYQQYRIFEGEKEDNTTISQSGNDLINFSELEEIEERDENLSTCEECVYFTESEEEDWEEYSDSSEKEEEEKNNDDFLLSDRE